MSRLGTAIHNDLQLLALARDEINLHAHLLSAEMSDRRAELERKWEELKSSIERAETAAGSAEGETRAAVELLVGSLKTGYARVRDALKS